MPDIESLMGPLAGLGFGGLTGAVVGYTAKKFTRLAALILGLAFILVQIMVHQGWIDIDWGMVQTTTEQAVSSGKGRSAMERAWEVLTTNLPWGSGFVAGFVVGFKLG